MPARLLVSLGIASALIAAVLPTGMAATDYTSDSFILRDPVITVEGGRATSTSFEYFSSTGQLDTGESSSASFTQRAGFLYFPVVTSPVVTAVAGDGKVTLTWSAATAALGYTVSGYQVGQSVSAGVGYAYTGVGNVLSSVRTGLNNGNRYYFVVRVLDARGDVIATSAEVSALPSGPGSGGVTTSAAPSSAPAAPGGGAGAAPTKTSTLVVSGLGFPARDVTLLKDGQIAGTAAAEVDGEFAMTLGNLAPGSYLFTVASEDSQGRQTMTPAVRLKIEAGATHTLAGMFLPPTVGLDKIEVKRGDPLAVSGQSAPGAAVTLFGAGPDDAEFVVTVTAGDDGQYRYALDTGRLQFGLYDVSARASRGSTHSSLGRGAQFTVGQRSVVLPPEVGPCALPADFNGDCRVNIVDFSILVYWFYRPSPPAHVDMSGDGRVNLVDFSILVYFWTG